MTRWSSLSLVALLAAAACDRDAPTAPQPDASLNAPGDFFPGGLGRPLGMLSFDQRQLFQRGRAVFMTVFTPASGLGPLFNANSCATCHATPVPGGVGPQIETHESAFVGGVCNDLEDIGGQVIQDSATPALQAFGFTKEPDLLEANGTGHRSTGNLMGFGLLEAIPDAEILARADSDDRNGDGISGRPDMTADGRVGRFGRKAQAATLDDFIAGAFIYEMGITNADEPDEQTIHGNPLPAGVDPAPDPEVSANDFDAAVSFVRFLAPPTARLFRFSFGDRHARFLFARVGCAGCHTPALYTGPNQTLALRNRVVYAYSDLLLHDMGPALADICLGQATPSEFRTEPLMGLRFKTAFLHDGRAHSIDEAIRLHDGEGARARDRFISLPASEQAALLRFLSGL